MTVNESRSCHDGGCRVVVIVAGDHSNDHLDRLLAAHEAARTLVVADSIERVADELPVVLPGGVGLAIDARAIGVIGHLKFEREVISDRAAGDPVPFIFMELIEQLAADAAAVLWHRRPGEPIVRSGLAITAHRQRRGRWTRLKTRWRVDEDDSVKAITAQLPVYWRPVRLFPDASPR